MVKAGVCTLYSLVETASSTTSTPPHTLHAAIGVADRGEALLPWSFASSAAATASQ